MCELLGISCSIPTSPQPYLGLFRKRGRKFRDGGGNPHGWGVALYPDGKGVMVIKEDIPAASSRLARFVSGYEQLRSQVFVAHVRKASRGFVVYRNSHPFSRELRGRDYVFAHNGTIHNAKMLSLGRFRPVGGTDSERLFCHILDHLESRRIRRWSEKDFLEFWNFLVAVNRRVSDNQKSRNKLNMLLTDGNTLIAYSDVFGRGTLHKLTISPQVEIDPACPQGDGIPGGSLTILTTKPLDDKPGWMSMQPGELCAVRSGVIVFSSGSAATNDEPGRIHKGRDDDL